MIHLYTSEEIQNGSRFIADTLNYCDSLPKITILSQAVWNGRLDEVLKQAVTGFLSRLAAMLSRKTGYSEEYCKDLIRDEAIKIENEENGKEYAKYYIRATKRLLEQDN